MTKECLQPTQLILGGDGVSPMSLHYGSEQLEYGTSNLTLSHELGSERVSERMSTAECASEASSVEKANE